MTSELNITQGPELHTRVKQPDATADYLVVRLMRNKTATLCTIPKVWTRVLGWRAGDHIRQDVLNGRITLTNMDAEARAAAALAHAEGVNAAPNNA